MEDHPSELLMRGLLRAYYWMDESLQNGLQQAGYPPRTRTQTMILINIADGITRAAELARVLGVSRQAEAPCDGVEQGADRRRGQE